MSSGLSTHIKKVLEGTGKKSLFSMIFSLEGLKMLADGNIGYMKLIKGYTQGTLVGSDHLGNRYYENDDLPYGRKRWVVYQDTFNYSPSGVPAEWHGWLNGINDFAPTRTEFKKPIYAVESKPSQTGIVGQFGVPVSYAPKGAFFTQRRNWKKYDAWKPSP